MSVICDLHDAHAVEHQSIQHPPHKTHRMHPENPGSKMYPEAPITADWPDESSSYRDKPRSYLLSVRRVPAFSASPSSSRFFLSSPFYTIQSNHMVRINCGIGHGSLSPRKSNTGRSSFKASFFAVATTKAEKTQSCARPSSAEIQAPRENFSNIALAKILKYLVILLVLPTRHSPKMPSEAGFCKQILTFISTGLAF